MSLKNKHGIIESDFSNYYQESRPVGISFQLKDGGSLFAPSSFLSHALFQDHEITLHFSFGLVRIRGERLKEIYTLLQTNTLSSLHCTDDITDKPKEPQIQEILFEASDHAVG